VRHSTRFWLLAPALIVGAVLWHAHARAGEDAKLNKARRLVELSGEANLDGALALSLHAELKGNLGTKADSPQGKVALEVIENSKRNSYAAGLVKLYAKHLDEATIDGLIQFYETPAGKALATKRSELWRAQQKLCEQERDGILAEVQKSVAKVKAKEAIAQSEARAERTLKVIAHAQASFREGDLDKNGNLDYAADLASLARLKLITPAVGRGTSLGYIYKLHRPELPGGNFMWLATASPKKPGKTGKRHFGINFAGQLRWADQPLEYDPKSCEFKNGTPLGN
tara:strand:+ start:587 stop:1438 length:852 start_codon:yes stop_codon:yes gene_type:complete